MNLEGRKELEIVVGSLASIQSGLFLESGPGKVLPLWSDPGCFGWAPGGAHSTPDLLRRKVEFCSSLINKGTG